MIGVWLFADTVRRHRATGSAPGEIRFAYWGGHDDHQMWSEIIDAFHRHEGGPRIRAEWLPISGYATKLQQQMIAGRAPDVFLFQDEPFPRFAESQFADLGEYLREDAVARERLDDCWPTAEASFRVGGQLRGLPVMGGTVLIYLNLNALERAERHHGRRIPVPSPPWSLDEFVEFCRLLTLDEDGDGRVDQFGLLQPHWVYYLPFIWSHGGRLLDDTGTRWMLDDDAALRAFRLYADWRHRWAVSPTPMEYAGQNSDTAFLSGRVAMCVNGPWFQAFLRETAMHDRYVVLQIPSGPGGSATRVTWDAVCINRRLSPERRAAAWRFARFLLTDEAQESIAARLRAIPVRRFSRAVYEEHGGGPDSAAAAFVRSLANCRMQPITKSWGPMSWAMSRHMVSVLLEGPRRRTPREALSALAEDPAITEAFEVLP